MCYLAEQPVTLEITPIHLINNEHDIKDLYHPIFYLRNN